MAFGAIEISTTSVHQATLDLLHHGLWSLCSSPVLRSGDEKEGGTSLLCSSWLLQEQRLGLIGDIKKLYLHIFKKATVAATDDHV